MYMIWQDDFRVGVERMDKQHQALVEMLNRLYDSMCSGQSVETLGEVLDGLIDYTRYHFADEEKLFEQAAYPGAQKHIDEHARLVAEVCDFSQRFSNGDIAFSASIMDFLKQWVADHILGEDKQFADYCHAQGIRFEPAPPREGA